MITLYHRPKTRSDRFVFLLEELGVPYELHAVTTLAEGKKDPANPHPHAKVPAIRDSDDGTVVFESAAIALYLTDKFPKAGLGPVVGDRHRGAYVTWLAYYAGVLEPAFISKFTNAAVPRPMAGWVEVDEAMAHVVETLSQGPWLLGDKFSAADVLYGTTFAMFGQSPLMPKSDLVTDYAKRVTGRPAQVRAAAKLAA